VKEMLLVGRGGEGVVLASQILAETFVRAGFWVQSFPEFTAERRGAPISAFLRWDETSPIHRRYKVQDCDVLVVVSPSPPSSQIIRTVKPGGLILLNRETRFRHSGPFDIARVPASRIAQRDGILSSEGRPMGNVAVLGACVRLLIPDGLGYLEQAVASRLGAMAEANIAAAREGYARCTRQHAVAGDMPVEPAPDPGPASEARRSSPVFAVSTTVENYATCRGPFRPTSGRGYPPRSFFDEYHSKGVTGANRLMNIIRKDLWFSPSCCSFQATYWGFTTKS